MTGTKKRLELFQGETVDSAEPSLEKLACDLARKGLAPLVIFFLEALKPLSFTIAQLLQSVEPVFKGVNKWADYYWILSDCLEDRKRLEQFILILEHGEEGRRG